MENEFRILLGTARIWGTIVATIMLYLGVTELRLPEGESLFTYLFKEGLFFLPFVIAGLGLYLALWKEGLGGGISLIGFIIGFFPIVSDADLGGLISTIFWSSIVLTPGILYLVYWWKMFQQNRK